MVYTLKINSRNLLLAILVAFPSLLFAGGTVGGAYTAEQGGRITMNFNTDWKFYQGNAAGADAKAFSDGAWNSVCLPHTPRLEKELLTGDDNYRGIHWYRRHFYLNSAYSGKKIFIEFETGSIVSDLWVNGTAFPTRYGMNLPIILDITSVASFGTTENVIAVRLNNSDDGSVPPGKVQSGSSGLDYMYFGGLYRNAHIYVTDKAHITDPVYTNKVASGGIFVTYPAVSTSSASIQVKTHIKNENTVAKNVTVKTYIVDPKNTIAAVMSTTQSFGAGIDSAITQSATITNPALWYPETPTLYRVYSTVLVDSTLVDNYTTRIGIRSISWVSKALVINGKSYSRLIGTNRHQDYPYIGNAGPNSMQYRDVKNLKQGGNLWVRFSHEPAGPGFLDACDSLGFMVMECMPGWQHWSTDATFQARCFQNIKDMMRRDRNHPCCIAWEVALNESAQTDAFGQSCADIAHKEYPGNQCFTSGGDWSSFKNAATIYDLFWGSGNAGPAIPMLREYGDWEFGGNTSTSRVQRSDGEAKMVVGISNRIGSASGVYSSGNTTAALATWVGIDYNRGYATPTCYAGLLDVFRLPKFVYYYYAAQRDPKAIQVGVESGPYIRIANWWTSTSPKDVTVCSNCEQVKLYINGKLAATQSPDAGQMFHPPFTFKSQTWASGMLRADGLIGGAVVTSDSVQTPGTATKITVTIDTMGAPLVADGSDKVFVYAYLRDANNTIVPTTGTSITFAASGEGSIVGNSSIGANPKGTLAGIAGAIVQVTRTPGAITVTATAGGMSGSATIQSLPFTEKTVPIVGTQVRRVGATPVATFLQPFAVHRTSNGSISIDIVAGDKFSMTIMNCAGKIMGTFSGKGTSKYLLKNGALAKGVFVVRVETEGYTYTNRFVVQ